MYKTVSQISKYDVLNL